MSLKVFFKKKIKKLPLKSGFVPFKEAGTLNFKKKEKTFR